MQDAVLTEAEEKQLTLERSVKCSASLVTFIRNVVLSSALSE